MAIHHYLYVSAILFGIGIFGVLMRKNLIHILLSVEIMLNASNLSFVAGSRAWSALDGQVIALFVIAIAASEVAVGLAIAILLFRELKTLNPNHTNFLKG